MGGPGSGGRNRKPLEQHAATGTYRPARHGPLDKVVPLRAPGPILPAPSGLSPASSKIWDETMRLFDGWLPHDVALFERALRAMDTAAACAREISKAKLTTNGKVHPLVSVRRTEEKFAADTLRALKLRLE